MIKKIAFILATLVSSLSFAQNTNINLSEYCNRVTNSQTIKTYVSEVRDIRNSKIYSDELSRATSQYLDDSNKVLANTVKQRIFAASNGDFIKVNEIVINLNKVAEECAARNINSDIFYFFAANNIAPKTSDIRPDSIEAQKETFSRNDNGPKLSYDGTQPKGKFEVEKLDPRWASIYVFAFDDAEQLVQESSKAAFEKIAEIKSKVTAESSEAKARWDAEQAKKAADSYSPPTTTFTLLAGLILTIIVVLIPFFGLAKVLGTILAPLNKMAAKGLEKAGLKDHESEVEINGKKVKVFTNESDLSAKEKEIKKLSKDGDALYKRGMELEASEPWDALSYYSAGEELNHPGCLFKTGTLVLKLMNDLDKDSEGYKTNVGRIKDAAKLGYQPAIDELKKMGIDF